MKEIELVIEGGDSLDLMVDTSDELLLGIERSQGTNNYEALVNKPSIEGHVLVGDSTIKQIGVGDVTPQDIDKIIFG